MPNITICPQCGRCYEETSWEQADNPDRRCRECHFEFLRTLKAASTACHNGAEATHG